jgi:hypothetical protein
MAWVAIGTGVAGAVAGSVVSGALSSSRGGGGGGGGDAVAASDPFASQRGQYQTMLSDMMTGNGRPATAAVAARPAVEARPMFTNGWNDRGAPAIAAVDAVAADPGTPGGGFTPNDPSYAWRFNQGLEAVNRSQAAGGGLNSGGRLTALTDYGQGQASTEYANQFSRLSQLAGANIGSPAAAGQIIAGQNAQQSQGAAAIGSAVSNGVKAWGASLGGNGGYTDMTGFQGNSSPSTWQGSGSGYDASGLGTGAYDPGYGASYGGMSY